MGENKSNQPSLVAVERLWGKSGVNRPEIHETAEPKSATETPETPDPGTFTWQSRVVGATCNAFS